MPLYEYVCHTCDREVELLVRPSDAEPTCPQCGDRRMTKLLSVPAVSTGPGGRDEPPSGPCGEACGCFPNG